jgi:dTDP-4-amino-4,6-dideoxygalactose transaminase
VSGRLLRLPLWMGISQDQQQRVVDTLMRGLVPARG